MREAQWKKHLLQKHDKWSPDPQHPRESWEGMAVTCNPSTQKMESGTPEANWLATLAGTGELQVQHETMLQ